MRWRILSVVGILYSIQFIPVMFIFMSLPIIMREAGHSATDIGLMQLVGIPHVAKFLWAPFIDKFKPGRNRYKSWIIVLTTIHVAALLVLAFMDPSGPLLPFFIVLLVAMVAISTQDVAVDALTISLMHPNERALGATFQTCGVYVGAIVGAFGFLQLYGLIGWKAVVFAQVALFAAPLLSLIFVDEPERQRGSPPVNYRNALRFFSQPRMGRWLMLLGTIRLPLLFVSLPIRLMMVDQGMSTEEISLWFGLIAMSCAGSAALFFGPLMRKLPRVLALYLVGFVNIGMLIVVCLLAATLPDAIRYAIVVTWVLIAITDTLLLRCAMDKVRPQFPGFDFSIQVALFTLLAMISSPIAGAIIDTLGYVPVFFTAVLLALAPLVILRIWFAPLRNAAVNLDGEKVVSTGTTITTKAMQIMDSCAEHLSEHGITCTRPTPELLQMEAMGCALEMKALDQSVTIRIETPTDNFMIFIRDDILEHIREIDPQAADRMCWEGAIKVGERPSNFHILRATKRHEVFPGLIRVTLSGIDVEALTSDGIHIKLMMPESRGKKPVWPTIGENGGISWPEGDDKLHTRFVTIRNIHLNKREIDVDIAHHEGGLISDWAGLQGDEQEVGIMGPGGDMLLPFTDNVILAADLTGLPALARLIEGAKGDVSGHLFATAPSQEMLENYLPLSKLKVTAVNTEVFPDEIVDMISHCTDDAVSYAWFGGEFTTARAVRSIFQDRFGLFKSNQHSMAYWRKSVSGHNP
jgi:NADPH-dependent ferric siderophore reductase/MFS family permease